MGETSEAALARQDERVNSISSKLTEIHNDQQSMFAKLEQMFIILSNTENRVRVLEEGAERHQLFMLELNNLKHEVAGAKRVMSAIWWVLTGITALVLTLRDEISQWLS